MISYQNLQEAKEAFGRDLTFGETMWFNYTAKKPDFILHNHIIFFLCIFYCIVPLIFVLLELNCFKSMDKYKLQPNAKKSFSDMFRCLKDVMRKFLLVIGPLQVVSYPTIKWTGIRTGLPLPSKWEIFCQLVVYFLVEDYTNYWLHRLLHCKWAYDNIHYVHHSYTAPIAFSASYSHWAEFLILGLPAFLGPALVPGHIVTYWLWFILREIESIETHSGYDFPWSPSKFIPLYGGAEYHDYHHFVGGQSKSNFASVFTYCDYIYGTDKGYRYQKSISQKPKEIFGQEGKQNGDSSSILKRDVKFD